MWVVQVKSKCPITNTNANADADTWRERYISPTPFKDLKELNNINKSKQMTKASVVQYQSELLCCMTGFTLQNYDIQVNLWKNTTLKLNSKILTGNF